MRCRIGWSDLADLLVNGVPLEERIVLPDLKTFRGVLFVLHRCITRSRLAFTFGFRAFERNDDSCALFGHDCVLRVVSMVMLRTANLGEKSRTAKHCYCLRVALLLRNATLTASEM